eukprot:8327065-Lingulodinium_polyedra.AAC.1
MGRSPNLKYTRRKPKPTAKQVALVASRVATVPVKTAEQGAQGPLQLRPAESRASCGRGPPTTAGAG